MGTDPRLMMSKAGRPDVIGVDDTGFEAFVAATSGRLFSMALLLTGGHRAEAEDLVQNSYERAYRHWARICRRGDPERYVRQILANASVDRWRRLRRRPEAPLPAGDGPVISDEAAVLADRDLLLRALAALAPGQRAVLVLRYFEDLSEAQTASVLGCSVGTVKSQAARGLARLRQAAAPVGDGAPRGGAEREGAPRGGAEREGAPRGGAEREGAPRGGAEGGCAEGEGVSGGGAGRGGAQGDGNDGRREGERGT